MRAWVLGLLLVLTGGVNLSVLGPRESRPEDSAFVTRHGEQLVLHGSRFRFVGINCYQLAEAPGRADQFFSFFAANGIRVVRFWAFQKQCGPDGRDFSAFDRIMAAARRHDIRLIPVLENHWQACTYGPRVKPADWYRVGWRTEALGPTPYLDYVRALAAHFRNEPQILCWQLVNEPEIYPDTEANCAVLRDFASLASRQLRRIDPNHLISLGLLGIGQPSTTGARFLKLHEITSIDVVSAHDYGYIEEPLPGLTWEKRENSLYADLCDARALAKPFLATEAGIPLSWVKGDHIRRAELFRAKLRAFFDAGGTGFLLWNYEPTPHSDHGFDERDPVIEVIREAASRLNAASPVLTQLGSEIHRHPQL